MRILGLLERARDLQCLSLLVTVLMTLIRGGYACGKYITLSPGQTYNIASPANYGEYKHCLWWVQSSSASYVVSMEFNFVGQSQNGRCGDYLTIRDGGETDTALIDMSCVTHTNQRIDSTDKTMWIQFKSDGINYTAGFQGTLTTSINTGTANATDPVVSCKSYQFQCANRLCMTLSYRCDGYNDCGCDEDCDEDGCGGLGVDRLTLVAIGISVGFGIFLVFFIFAFAYETHLKRKAALADSEAQAELQKKKTGRHRQKDKKKSQKEKKGGWTG